MRFFISGSIDVCVIIKKDTDLFNEIPVVDASQWVSSYLVNSMLIIVEDHLFSQCPFYCELLLTDEKHD